MHCSALLAATGALSVWALSTASAFGAASGKPAVYNYVGKGAEREGAAELKAYYGRKYTVIDFSDDRSYVRSRATHTVRPRSVVQFGQLMSGSVRVVFVVTTTGRVADPYVLASTNRQLNSKVTEIIQQWRGTPARLNGAPIAVLQAQDFTFMSRGETLMLRKAHAQGQGGR